jgi:hypothetical protein
MTVPIVISYDFFANSGASESYFTTVAQVIAALYLTVAIEAFVDGGVVLTRSDQVEFGVLLTISWLGLLACIRGVVVQGEPWTAGLGGAGLMASIFLVTTTLANRVVLRNPHLVPWVIITACLAPLLILIPPH